MGHVRVRTTKTLTKSYDYTDQKTNYDADTNTSDVKRIKNRRKQNFEDEGKKHAIGQRGYSRSDLNCKFLSVILVLKYPDSYICCYCGQ